jgi:P-loop containing NTP hydrolase pore-1
MMHTFTGDSAGVGKGRQLAGLVLENTLKGRSKHVWISIGTDLAYDARRDLDDIGAGPRKSSSSGSKRNKATDGCNIPLHPLHKLPYGALKQKDGVM